LKQLRRGYSNVPQSWFAVGERQTFFTPLLQLPFGHRGRPLTSRQLLPAMIKIPSVKPPT